MTLVVADVRNNPSTPSVSAKTYKPDQLIAGRLPQITDSVILISGSGVVIRGTVLGVITASGKYAVSTTAATDGSQNPAAVLVDDYDATSADVSVGVYEMGEFNERALTIGAGWTIAALKPLLRLRGIYLKHSVSAADPT